MKHLFKSVLAVALLVVSQTGPACNAQVTPTTFGNFASIPAVMPSVAVSNTTSQVSVRKDRGIALLASVVATNSAVSNVVFTFQVSADGTNYSTISPFQIALPLNGTTEVQGYTNVPPAILNNVRYLRLGSISNFHNATVTINRLQYSYSN